MIFITKPPKPHWDMRSRCLPVLLPAVLSAPLAAERVQAPDAPWRTLRTAHYRIHYPVRGGFEPFAMEVASKIEGIHAKVVDWVGYESPVPVEVVIKDPLLEANGLAVALLEHPFVILWRTPPEPDSGLAHLTTWVELLVTHELTHVHHLLRPQNRPNLGDKLLDFPVGPIARKAPRWVSEGYATVIEGKITGKGRPHSAYRAAVIRQWALEGKLPDYGRISATEGFRGGGMAYLVGSAYLEWLEARTPQDPEILKKFWKQLASKKRRDFEASFKATFGFAARDGYDRWRAEVSRDALELERRAKAEGWIREGELFTKVDGEVSDLAVSPDGSKLLARVLTKEFRGLRVWDLNEKDPHRKSGKPRPEPKPDPQEVQDAKPAVPDRKARWELGRVGNVLPRRAAWNGDRVRIEIRRPNGEGVLEPSLWSWKPGEAVGASEPGRLPEPTGSVSERHGLWTILDHGQPLVRTLSAAWNPAETPDGKAIYYAQLAATGVEIRRIERAGSSTGNPPPADPTALTARTVLPPADDSNSLEAPVPAPAPVPYDAWGNLWSGSRFGAGLAPSGHAYQIGYGGGDLLGRASWHALAGIGDAAGPRGAALGLAWRGWRWSPALEVFSSLERPSRQDWFAPAGLDRERRGAELSFSFDHRGVRPYSVRPTLAAERLDWLGKDSGSRKVAGLASEVWFPWRPTETWALAIRMNGQAQAGRTGSADWNLLRGGCRMQLLPPPDFPVLTIEGEAGRIGGDTGSPLDRFRLGGLETSLVPASLDTGRIAQAALPSHLQSGDRFRRGRVSLGRAFRGYWEAAVAWDHTLHRPAFQRVAGLEIAFDELLPGDLFIALLGRLKFTAGIHRILQDAPGGQKLKDKQAVTLNVVLRP